MDFKLVSEYKPTGDQPKAIESLVKGVEMGLDDQVLLGVTGSGKTFTMANVIAELNRPTLVLAHNKTLAAQLCSEFREFFPENAVEYFISYYDYYQPEAYIAHTDTYIEKDSAINDEIERLRHSATSALSERRDVIVVSSVSCIYGLGDPIDYKNMVISLRTGQTRERDELMRRLTDIRYERNDMNFTRNTFRVRGDTLEIYPAYWAGRAIRVEFFGDEIDRISEINAVTGMPERVVQHVAIYPASHYVASKEKMARAMHDIEEEMWQQVKFFESHDKLLEAQRIRQRTQYDLEMLSEIGFCTGIENYSRVIEGRAPGSPPHTLLDYFPKDFVLFIDESHYYKNLFLYTKMRNVSGIAQTEAQKSSDLFMKCRYLDEITGGRGVVFATGTPISNSMVELYTIQRYLQMGALQEQGFQHFDAWAANYGETVTAIELAPEGYTLVGR